MLHKLVLILNDFEYLFSSAYKHPKRSQLIRDYIRIRTKAFLNRWFHFNHEHFLSYTVSLESYDIFFAIFRQVFVHHAYYLETKTQNPTIIDCGGNMGMSVLYFKYLYPEAEVTVFEPSQEIFATLERNVTSNNLSKVRIVQAAVNNREGEISMYPRGAAACGNTVEKNISDVTPTKNPVIPYIVKSVLLSTYITSTVHMLKLDIEGSEGAVIQELESSQKLKYIEQCAMEYHYYPGAKDNNLIDILKRFETRSWMTQLFYEELQDVTQQLGLEQNGSYSISLRTAKAKAA